VKDQGSGVSVQEKIEGANRRNGEPGKQNRVQGSGVRERTESEKRGTGETKQGSGVGDQGKD
jgi:hypothetical protein